MKFKISRDVLLKPVHQVIGVVERRQTLPILSNLLLRIQDGALAITANDLEVELVATTGVIDGEDGAITVPARKLLDICRALPEDVNLELGVEGDRAVVRSGRSRFVLATLPAADFPATEVSEATQEVRFSQGLLRRLIEKTHFCMAHQDVRYFLNGLLLELAGPRIRAVATDGHRLAMCEADSEAEIEELRQVIVPRKGVNELLRLLADVDEPVQCYLGSNHIQVILPRIRFTSKLVDGRFPDYERVLPQDLANCVVATRDLLRQALVRASILSNEKFRGVRLGVGAAGLQIVAHNPEQEEAEEEMEVQYDGEPMEVGFNVNYLLDALAAIEGDVAHLWLRDGDKSCLIEAGESALCKYVVMPMRL